ncbi:MAG: hypothetical protein O3A53_00430 [Acidobacteria bacterium]|nr:hypothetical protein [Acidobacteriota bacterium]MDA1233246.1 hypothetical protein [Acidobacteriota bacterium]
MEPIWTSVVVVASLTASVGLAFVMEWGALAVILRATARGRQRPVGS